MKFEIFILKDHKADGDDYEATYVENNTPIYCS